MGIAHSLRMMGDFERALEVYDEISKKYKKREVLADALTGKALCLKGLSRSREAIKFLKKAEKIYEEKNDEIGLAYLYWAYCVVLRISSDFERAREYGERALAIFNYFKDKKGIIYSCCALGGLSRIIGNLGDSFDYYKKANEGAKILKDKFGTAYSFCGLGNYYRMKYEFKKAMEFFNKAIEIYGEIGDLVSCSYTLWSLGILETLKGKYDDAEGYFERSLYNFEITKDKRGIVYSLIGLIQLKFLQKKSYNLEKKKCMEILKKYEIPWEKILFEILISKLERRKKNFSKEIASFGSSYNFLEFPINFP